MTRRWRYLGGTVVGLMLTCLSTGCPSGPQPATVGSAASSNTVSGTVAYRERIALPVDATVELWMTDVSPLITAQVLVAETTFAAGGRQVPIPFQLHFEPRRIDPSHNYAVKAAIRGGGEILFASDSGLHVITNGSPTEISLMLETSADTTLGQGGLEGTSWRLEDLGGTPALAKVEVTLAFTEAGKVAGRASCNRFFGAVQIDGQSIRFSGLGSTKMACVDAGVMEQETKYLAALEGSERYAIDGGKLLLHSKGMAQPLRFARASP